MSTEKHLKALADLDDQIVDFDQEDLDGINDLLDKRNELVEGFVEPEFEPFIPPDDTDDPGPTPDVPKLTVEFTDTHVVITSNVDRIVEVGGDVRDSTVKLKANKANQRSLTKEGNGFVTVDSVEYPRS